jgi:hypothetical protein
MKGGKRQTIKIKIGGGEMVTKYGGSSELRQSGGEEWRVVTICSFRARARGGRSR